MDVRIERLERWLQGETAPPVRLEAELTDRCNLSCIFCWRQNETFARAILARQGHAEDELEDHHWLRLVAESSLLGVTEWHLCGGGEPLVRKSLALQLTSAVKLAGMTGLLTTNGALIDDEVARQLVASQWDVVEISMESPAPFPNDFLRGNGSYARAVTALERLNHYKSFFGSDRPRLQIAIVLCSKNYSLLPALMQFAYEMGCSKLSANPIVTPPGAPAIARSQRLSNAQLQELPRFIGAALETAKTKNLETNIADFFATCFVAKTDRFNEVIADHYDERQPESLQQAHCFAPWQTISIRPNGLAGPCVAYRYGEGEDVRRQSLAEIWTGEYFNLVRELLIKRRPPDYCSRCCAPFLIDGEQTRQTLSTKNTASA